MKKNSLFLSILMILLLFSCSEDNELVKNVDPMSSVEQSFINENEAMDIAEKFIDAQELLGTQTKSSEVKLEMVYTDLKDGLETKSGQQPAYYIFNMENGYVIVSANKATLPVLGYSIESAFDPKNIPSNMAEILIDFKKEINYARSKGLKVDASILEARSNYLDGTLVRTKANAYSVNPLLGNIKWNQSPYYNAYCPGGSPVGCTATAASQIMRYWKYPSASTGYHSYRSSWGTLSFDYNYRINWNNMPAATLRRPNDEVAKFCYGVAVGVDMNFSRGGSGAYQSDVPAMLKEHYKYPSDVTALFRQNYNYNEWANIIRRELNAGRPVQYAGHGTGGGHSFVCDGYSANGYFHFNWGWGGVSDGYFLLNALNPGSLGTGGGAGGFNSYQEIVVNFAPPSGWNDGSDPDPDPNPVPVDYCSSNSNSTYYGYIKQVKIGGVYYNSNGSNTGYSDFSKEWKFCVDPGQYYTYYLTPGSSSSSYNMYWKVWIDYNNDGEFSDDYTETVAQGYGYNTINGSFQVPSNLKTGDYRIRVSVSLSGYPSPCGEFENGEVEDHTLCVH